MDGDIVLPKWISDDEAAHWVVDDDDDNDDDDEPGEKPAASIAEDDRTTKDARKEKERIGSIPLPIIDSEIMIAETYAPPVTVCGKKYKDVSLYSLLVVESRERRVV